MDKEFKYVPAVDTDIRKTFERIRLEQEKLKERERENAAEALRKTISMRKAR